MSDAYRFPVDLTSIMLFASALGETNPIYYDEEQAARTPLGGVIAPPTFSIASAHWNPDHPLRGVRRIPPPAPAPESGGGGGPNLARVLHGELVVTETSVGIVTGEPVVTGSATALLARSR